MNYMYGNVMYYLNLRKLWLSDAYSYIFHLPGRGPSENFVWRGGGMFQMLLYLISNFLWLCYMNLKYLNLSKGGGGLTSWRPRPCNSCIPLNELYEVIHYLHVNSFYSLCFPFRFEEVFIRPFSVLELMTRAARSWVILNMIYAEGILYTCKS